MRVILLQTYLVLNQHQFHAHLHIFFADMKFNGRKLHIVIKEVIHAKITLNVMDESYGIISFFVVYCAS